MDVFNAYKTMPEWHKSNIENYYILNGIYTVSPNISDEDAQFIFLICKKVDNENVNPFSISHFLTDNYINKNITKSQLQDAKPSEIVEAVYFDNLDYISSISEEKNIEI